VSKHQKNTSLSILYILFLTIVGYQNSNYAYKLADKNPNIEIEKEKVAIFSSAILKPEYFSSEDKKNADVLASPKVLEDENKIQFNSRLKQAYLNSVQEEFIVTKKLISNVYLDTLTSKNPEDDEITLESNIVLDIIQKVSLFFFLLFFFPLGIFYPLFILYRKLLDSDEGISSLEDEIFENYLPITYPLDNIELDLDLDQVTISKLQVAFLPKIANLKHQLEQASLNVEKQSENKALDLMRNVISIFITQQHWSHASCESLSFSIVEAQKQFDTVLSIEQDKCIDKKLSLVNIGQKQQTLEKYTSDTFRYTVVTMVFYTIRNNILFEQIDTKENLAKLLINLSQINGDELLKFELLWNPLEEEEFITNEQLLMHYEDMVRLF